MRRRHGLFVVDVDRRSAQTPGPERVHQRVGIHHRTPRAVHQNRAFLHQSELACANHSAAIFGKRHVHADDVGLGQQFVQCHETHPEPSSPFRRWMVGPRDHLHPYRASHSGHLGPDIPRTHDAQHLILEVYAIHPGPLTRLHPRREECRPFRCGKHQSEHVFGHHRRGSSRLIANDNPVLSGGFQVEHIGTYRTTRNHPKIGQLFEFLSTPGHDPSCVYDYTRTLRPLDLLCGRFRP